MRRDLRPVEMDEDMGAGHSDQVETASNLRSGTIANKTGRNASHGETPISPYDYVQLGLPKTQTTKHNYYNLITTSIASGNGSTAISSQSWRLNSIYDIFTSVPFVALDTTAPPTPDTNDGVINTPKWREYFNNIYNYWTVLGCQYKIRVRCTNQNRKNAVFAAFLYKHGAQAPPIVNTGQTTLVPFDYKKLHPGVEFEIAESSTPERTRDDETNNNNTNLWVTGSEKLQQNWVTFSGTVKPGMVDHDVIEDEMHQTWHRNTEVPPIRELLTLHIMRHPMSEDVAMDFQVEVDLMYLVQWKDIKSSLQYITANSQVLSTFQGSVAQVL